MVISGRINKVAFYCRMNYVDRDYSKYLVPLEEALEKRFGEQKWDRHIFYEIASGTDAERKEYLHLISEIKKGNVHVVITVRAAMIARDWGQFLEFMELCDKQRVPVVCIQEQEDAESQYQLIKNFRETYFEGGGQE